MPLITCKKFMEELSDYLDGEVTGELRKELEAHLSECPNCWVVCDTTKKTIQIYKGMDAYPIPEKTHARLMDALQKKMQADNK